MGVGVLSVGLGPGLDSMSPARSRRSASHAAGTHGRLPQKTGRPGLRRGGVGGYNLHSVPPNSPPDCGTVAHQPRAGCIRLVHHLPIITTINIRHDYKLQQNRQTFTNYKNADWTQLTEDTESTLAQTTHQHTHCHNFLTNIILIAICITAAGSYPTT